MTNIGCNLITFYNIKSPSRNYSSTTAEQLHTKPLVILNLQSEIYYTFVKQNLLLIIFYGFSEYVHRLEAIVVGFLFLLCTYTSEKLVCYIGITLSVDP